MQHLAYSACLHAIAVSWYYHYCLPLLHVWYYHQILKFYTGCLGIIWILEYKNKNKNNSTSTAIWGTPFTTLHSELPPWLIFYSSTIFYWSWQRPDSFMSVRSHNYPHTSSCTSIKSIQCPLHSLQHFQLLHKKSK